LTHINCETADSSSTTYKQLSNSKRLKNISEKKLSSIELKFRFY